MLCTKPHWLPPGDSHLCSRVFLIPGPPGSEMMQVALAKTLALKYNARLLIFDKQKMGLTGLASRQPVSGIASHPLDVNPLDGGWESEEGEARETFNRQECLYDNVPDSGCCHSMAMIAWAQWDSWTNTVYQTTAWVGVCYAGMMFQAQLFNIPSSPVGALKSTYSMSCLPNECEIISLTYLHQRNSLVVIV